MRRCPLRRRHLEPAKRGEGPHNGLPRCHSFACQRGTISACRRFASDDASDVQRALVVSIHDVAPATRARIERMLAQVAKAGVPRCSLLVVPDYHHSGRSLGESGFVAWLQELSAQGHEIVLHGFSIDGRGEQGSPRDRK